jgi:hypothetical protein
VIARAVLLAHEDAPIAPHDCWRARDVAAFLYTVR